MKGFIELLKMVLELMMRCIILVVVLYTIYTPGNSTARIVGIVGIFWIVIPLHNYIKEVTKDGKKIN